MMYGAKVTESFYKIQSWWEKEFPICNSNVVWESGKGYANRLSQQWTSLKERREKFSGYHRQTTKPAKGLDTQEMLPYKQGYNH